jgi:ParB family transcriptional regulator, chromosome partitioning protein
MSTTTISVNPFRCRMWIFHDRMDGQLTENSCRPEIESISRNGQLVPVLGRALRGDPDHDIELIYGARRLFVARHLNVPLHVEMRELSDREAMVAMDIENRLRKDVSPYERGLSFSRCLRGGCFQTQEELAQSLRISGAQVSRLLAIARLPAAIISAFPDPREICETWGLELKKALEDPQQRRLTLERARRLSEGPPRRATDIFTELVSLARRGRRRQVERSEEVVADDHGVALFRIRQLRNEVALVVSLHDLSPSLLNELRALVKEVLQCRSREPQTTPRSASVTSIGRAR